MLAGAPNVVPVMYYVSDHGESLGENGLYLHAAPWFMAPTEQTHVPMVTWVSPEAESRLGLTKACLDARKADTLSHDNMFATVLGMLDIQTEARDPALDLTADCRN
jgi:lipid A ethanolaminephosphotransferase